jgi:acetate kinase
LLYLQRSAGLSVADLGRILNHESGLKGLSEIGSDMRAIEQAAASGDSQAALALDIFAYRVRKYIGAYAAALGGLDAVAFTGGIGEHSPTVRARICDGLEFLGLHLDAGRNAAASGTDAALLSADGSPIAIWLIPTDEERQIAREAVDVL